MAENSSTVPYSVVIEASAGMNEYIDDVLDHSIDRVGVHIILDDHERFFPWSFRGGIQEVVIKKKRTTFS